MKTGSFFPTVRVKETIRTGVNNVGDEMKLGPV